MKYYFEFFVYFYFYYELIKFELKKDYEYIIGNFFLNIILIIYRGGGIKWGKEFYINVKIFMLVLMIC